MGFDLFGCEWMELDLKLEQARLLLRAVLIIYTWQPPRSRLILKRLEALLSVRDSSDLVAVDDEDRTG